MRLTVLILLFLNAPTQSDAGAWLREKGAGFLSFGHSLFATKSDGLWHDETSIYFEYGIAKRVTAGAHGSLSQSFGSEGYVFLRMPLRNKDRPAKLSFELGLGAQDAASEQRAFFRTAVSWGKDFKLGKRAGWANFDFGFHTGPKTAHLLKLDATAGLTLNDRFIVMGQAFFEADESGDSLTLVPSVIMTPKKNKARFILGYENRRGRRASDGVRFGIWRDF